MTNVRIITSLLGLLFLTNLSAQFIPDRYINEVFSNVTVTEEVKFSTAVPQPEPGGGFYEGITGFPVNVEEFNTTDVDLFMDIYEPTGDVQGKRPVIIICFGGGFVTGSKDHWSMVLLAQDLAKKGYVTATIDYRLGMNMFDAGLAERAVYRGLQDGRSAVRFFKADAAGSNLYNVDADNIYIGGHSAGAFIGVHNAYLDKESERPLSTYDTYIQYTGFFGTTPNALPDQLCIDCEGDNQSESGHAKAIFSLAGAIGDLDFMESGSDPSAVMFHSSDDGTVPYVSGEPFGDISFLVVGSDLPIVYGSSLMADEATTLGIPYEFYSYSDRGHGVHEDGDTDLYDDITPGITDWFYNHLLKPVDHSLTGNMNPSRCDLSQTYTTEANLAELYDWQVTGGSLVLSSTTSNSATVLWDDTATSWSIAVTPYSCQGARGDTVTMDVNLVESVTNTWLSTTGDWSDPANWSLGRTPLICDDVVMPAQVVAEVISIPVGDVSDIRSLFVGELTTLLQANTSILNVVGGGNVTVDGILIANGTINLNSIIDVNPAILDVNGTVTINTTGVINITEANALSMRIAPTATISNMGIIVIDHSINNTSMNAVQVDGSLHNDAGLLQITGNTSILEMYVTATGSVTNTNNGSIVIEE